MDNLHRAIWEYFDDFHQPSAKGSAYPTPWIWPEEAHADAAVYEEQKKMNAQMKPYFVPKWLYRDKPEQPEQKEEFAVDEKELAHILMEFDEIMAIRMKAKKYNIQDARPEVWALVDLAAENGWKMTEPEKCWPRTTYVKVYRVR